MENQLKYSSFIFVIIIIFITQVGCKKNNESTMYFGTNKYKQELQEFPEYLVDFFPDSMSNTYSVEKSIDTTNQSIYYMNFDFDSPNLEHILTKYKNRIKKSYSADDSTLVIIKRAKFRDNLQPLTISGSTRLSPIPFFESADLSGIGIENEKIYSDSTRSGLSNNFNIYILDSKSGNYWKGLKPQDYMPEGWKNGYSKGVCINEKDNIIIYWFLIW